jgi:hypothetical protein
MHTQKLWSQWIGTFVPHLSVGEPPGFGLFWADYG